MAGLKEVYFSMDFIVFIVQAFMGTAAGLLIEEVLNLIKRKFGSSYGGRIKNIISYLVYIIPLVILILAMVALFNAFDNWIISTLFGAAISTIVVAFWKNSLNSLFIGIILVVATLGASIPISLLCFYKVSAEMLSDNQAVVTWSWTGQQNGNLRISVSGLDVDEVADVPISNAHWNIPVPLRLGVKYTVTVTDEKGHKAVNYLSTPKYVKITGDPTAKRDILKGIEVSFPVEGEQGKAPVITMTWVSKGAAQDETFDVEDIFEPINKEWFIPGMEYDIKIIGQRGGNIIGEREYHITLPESEKHPLLDTDIIVKRIGPLDDKGDVSYETLVRGKTTIYAKMYVPNGSGQLDGNHYLVCTVSRKTGNNYTDYEIAGVFHKAVAPTIEWNSESIVELFSFPFKAGNDYWVNVYLDGWLLVPGKAFNGK